MTGQQITTAAELDALPVGRDVRDRHGDVWTKMPDGRWDTPETARFDSATLARKWGPFTPLAVVERVAEVLLRHQQPSHGRFVDGGFAQDCPCGVEVVIPRDALDRPWHFPFARHQADALAAAGLLGPDVCGHAKGPCATSRTGHEPSTSERINSAGARESRSPEP